MPATIGRPDLPADNPHRDANAVRREFVETTDDRAGLGLSIDDLNVMLARHYEHGRQVGSREALEGNRDLLARTYDSAWQRGMWDHHARSALTYGQRIHALHELLHLVPQLPAPLVLPLLLDVTTLARQVIGSFLADHARGPFDLPDGDEDVPDPLTPPTDERSMSQQAEDALRARVVQLRDWLRGRVEPVGDGPDPEPSADELVRQRYAER
jgi:hypothetical protein